MAPRTRRSIVVLGAAVAMLVASAPAASDDVPAEPRVPDGAVVLVGDKASSCDDRALNACAAVDVT